MDLALKEELESLNDEELYDSFYTDLTFGTGGMRGIMGMGPNRMNVVTISKATLGFARYLLNNEENAKERGVVIATDNRINNTKFMMAAANILTTLGIKVYIFDALRPTPELSFAVRYLNACGGINITASHNPKIYNGYKIYNSEGNQLILKQSNIVMDEISKIENELAIEVNPNNDLLVTLGKDVDEAYYQMVMETSLNKEMKKDNITIVYTPQHGTGYVPVTTVLNRLGYKVIEVKEQCEPRGDFANTLSPNPEEKNAYNLAIEYAKKYNADLICCTDPDCDRIGIVIFDKENNPIYMTGNQTGAILINYLLSVRKQQGILPDNGIMYNTIVSSPLGAKVANMYGVETEQTLTGFKYIGDKIARALENNGKVFQIGYEESYGYLINPAVRDKDGVQSVMLICEMAAYYRSIGSSIKERLEEIYGKYGRYLNQVDSFEFPGLSGMDKMASIMTGLRNNPPTEIGGYKVVKVTDYKKPEETGLPAANVLIYGLEGGATVVIRPSGTEPKIKTYFTTLGKDLEEAKTQKEQLAEAVKPLLS